MSKDPLHLLLENLRAEEGAQIPTSSLGRLRRAAVAGVRVGIGSLSAKLRGRDLNLGSLSPEALAGLVESLGELKGIAMKVGQILSYVDGSLDPEARELLAVLQRYSQPTPFAQIERTIQEDLGDRAQALLARLEREPVAAASIGQVHRGVREDGLPVAVKVRHPGIETAIRADFKAAAIGKVMARTFAPGLDIAEIIEEAQARFLEECDYVGTLYRHGLFNADPHPGNLLFSPEGSVTILDHGCVREFDHDTVVGLVRLSRAVRADDEQRIQSALCAIGMPEPAADFDVTRGLLRGFFAPLLVPGRHAVPADRAVAMGETVKLKRRLMRMRLPGKLMFLFRIRFGLYAVLARIGAELDWAALEDELAGDLGR